MKNCRSEHTDNNKTGVVVPNNADNATQNGDSRTAVNNYVSFKEAIEPNIETLLNTQTKKCINESEFSMLLNSLFQDKLEKIPVNLEKYVVIFKCQIQLYCEICAIRITGLNSREVCVRTACQHIKCKNHKRNVQNKGQYFDTVRSNFDLNDAIFLENFSSLLPEEVVDEKNYLKAVLCVCFKCKLCNTEFQGYNKIEQVRNTIYRHINEESHVSKYMDTFPKPKYQLVCAQEVLNLSLDTIFDRAETFVSKEIYSEIINKIYQNNLEKIPEGTERFISIKLQISLNCSLCMRNILDGEHSSFKEKTETHISGWKHKNLYRKFIISDYNTTKIDAYTKLTLTDDMVIVPDCVVEKLFSVTEYANYVEKLKRVANGNFIFETSCIICEKTLNKTEHLNELQKSIERHIYSKRHMSNYVNQIQR